MLMSTTFWTSQILALNPSWFPSAPFLLLEVVAVNVLEAMVVVAVM